MKRAPALALIACALLPLAAAAAAEPLPPAVLQEAAALAHSAAAALAPAQARIEVEPGMLDARLRLAPCNHVQPWWPAGSRAWGRTRIGLRCTEGTTPWNVYLPLTVKVIAEAAVAAAPLPAGTVIEAAHLRRALVDWAAEAAPVVADENALVGRTLARSVGAGAPLRSADLKARQWFAAGDTVRLEALGEGFAVAGEGQALANGIEGQSVRVRTEGGRVVVGQPRGERRVEIGL